MAPSFPYSCLVGDFDCFLGIEFEFVARGIRGGRPRCLEKPKVGHLSLEQAMRIQELGYVLRNANIRTWNVVKDGSVADFANSEKDDEDIEAESLSRSAREQGFEIQVPGPKGGHQFWVPHLDPSVVVDCYQTMAGLIHFRNPAQGCEISTRVMRASEAAEEVTRALAALRANMEICNSTEAGLHVHLSEPPSGTNPGGTVSVLTMRKMISLMLMLEGSLFKLCDPSRLQSRFCVPTTEVLRSFAAYSRRDRKLSKLGREHISAALKHMRDKSELVAMVWDEERTNFSFQFTGYPALRINQIGNSDSSVAADTWDFEFRHLEGTMDPALACQWARVCCALLRIAATSTKEAFRLKMLEVDGMLTEDCPALHHHCSIPLHTLKLRNFLQALGIYDSETYNFWLAKLANNGKVVVKRPIAEDFLPPLTPD